MDSPYVQIEGARARAERVEFDQYGGFSTECTVHWTAEKCHADIDECIAIIESRMFLRECIRRSVQSAFGISVEPYSSVLDLGKRRVSTPICLIIVSLSEENSPASANVLSALSERVSGAPIVVLSDKNDLELARVAIGHGAKGYIPVTMGFEIAIEAVRFVLAGGTYVPADCLLAARSSEVALSLRSSAAGAVTARELAVVQAIQEGKPNKIIAHELNLCESTVKVHVRNIMKKLAAKNRTDVAIKATALLSCSGCTTQRLLTESSG
jgi:DNA-binding NarL/FixJ family response regulator